MYNVQGVLRGLVQTDESVRILVVRTKPRKIVNCELEKSANSALFSLFSNQRLRPYFGSICMLHREGVMPVSREKIRLNIVRDEKPHCSATSVNER